MAQYPIFDDVDINDLYKDLNQAIYMLHYLNDEVFSRGEIQDVCFSIKVTLNTLEKQMENVVNNTGLQNETMATDKEVQGFKEAYRDLEEKTIKYKRALMDIKHWESTLEKAKEHATKVLIKCGKRE